MTISTPQRLERLKVRLDELRFWLVRDHLDLTQWSFNGLPLALGAPWPERDAVQQLAHPEVAIPAAWPIAETWLELDVGGESLLTVAYARSQEQFGLDPYHQRFPLQADTFSLKIEMVARLPFGVPHPDPRLRLARAIWLDTALDSYCRLLSLVLETSQKLAEQEVAPVLLRAAERSLTILDWPSHTPDYLPRLQGSDLFNRLWQAPSGLSSHPPALSEAQRGSVISAHEQLKRDLRELQTRYPPQGRLLLSGHAHIDLAWLWPIEETRRKAQRTFSGMLSLLARYPEFTFNQSHAQYYAWLEEDDPNLLAGIKAYARAGRWEPIGGMWVEPDTNMPTGESLARQLLYGQRYFEQQFGSLHRVGWLPDCFGFAPALPQIYKLAGIDSFFTTKTNWNETNRFPYDLFWWEGLDGTRLLAHTFFNPKDGYNGLFEAETLHAVWSHYRGKQQHPEGLLTLGYGDGGGGTTTEMLERQRAAEVLPALPQTRWGRVDDYFMRLHQTAQTEPLPVWLGEIYLELHRGTLSSQGRTKRLHRQAERSLLAAEVMTSLIALQGINLPMLQGGKAPGSLEPLWRELLKNQFHDILPGSSIGEVYAQAERELATVTAQAAAVAHDGLQQLAGAVAPGERPGLLIVNPELTERPVRVELSEAVPGAQAVDGGFVVSDRRPVPGLAASIRLDCAPPAGLSVSQRHLENALVRIELAEDGTLARIWDKRAGREVLAGRGNQLWAYVDKPRNWDAWDIDVDYRAQGQEITDLAGSEVIEAGPHRVALRLTRRFRASLITQELRLWANSARLEFATHLAWHERHWLLKTRFPVAVRSEYATFETAYGVVRRPTHSNTTWDAARFEVAAHRFATLSEPGYGVALLNDGRYGHHALPSELGLTILRSPVLPDPYADEGEHRFRYAIYPYSGSWLEGGVLMEAEDLNQPLRAHPVRAARETAWQPLRLEGLPVALGALKGAEDGHDLILRVYEPQGARGGLKLTLPEGWQLAGEVDLLERPLAESPDIRPFQVKTWRLTRAP